MSYRPGSPSLERQLAWLEPAQAHAAGRWEAAGEAWHAQAQQLCKGPVERPDARSLFKLLSSQLCDAYAALCDWDSMQRWMHELQVWHWRCCAWMVRLVHLRTGCMWTKRHSAAVLP